MNLNVEQQNISRRNLLIYSTGSFMGSRHRDAFADSYPSSTVKIIVPYSAGGIGDVLARKIAERLSPALGQAVVVENRPGASGAIGLAAVTTMRPDGHTVALGATSNLAVSPALGAPVKYDPVRSFEPIILFGYSPMVVLAHPSAGVATITDLIVLAKRKPGELNFSTGGHGTIAHLTGELFKKTVGIDMLHVPYKGTTPALTAVLANEVSIGIDFPETSAQFVAAGKLRALMVTGGKRVASLPGVPHAVEAGFPRLDVLGWTGLVAPIGTPIDAVSRLNKEIGTILKEKEFRAHFARAGWQAAGGSPEDFRNFIRLELRKWSELVRITGVRFEP